MANDINAAGYETKPWWPYVRELMSNQVTVESVTILENGVYTAPAGKAYSPVTVNVPTYEVDSLSVTENGTYTPETGNAYNSVTVNVPQTQLSSLSVTENGTYTPEAGHAYNSVVVNVPSDFPTVTVTLNSSVSTATSEDDNIGFEGQGVDGDGYPTVTALYKYDTHYTISYVFDVTTPERVVDIMMCGESFSIIAFHPMTATGSATVETVSDPSGSYYKATVTGDCELTISDLT